MAPALATDAPDTSLASLTWLDWMGVLVVSTSGLFALGVPLFVAPVFRRLGESLGAQAPSLPAALLQGWTPVLVGALPLALLAYGLVVRQSVARRRVALLLAFVLTVVECVVFLLALYATLFVAAGSAAGSS